MPPWYIEKDIGIQHYKNDISLSDEEVAKIARWADSGAPRGNPADMPRAAEVRRCGNEWTIGTPDLIVKTPPVSVKAVQPDWWGPAGFADTGLTEDRYVSAVEIKEVNDQQGKAAAANTVGGLFIFHHALMGVEAPGAPARLAAGGWPVHEVGRNADVFNPEAGKLLRAGSRVGFGNVHMHANGKDTTGHLEVAFKFHPKDYKPKFIERLMPIGTGDIDIRPMEAGQKVEAFMTLTQPTKVTVFEPHMHAAAVRMCLDAIFGSRHGNPELLGLRPQLGARLSVRGRLGAAAAARHDPPRHRLLRQHAGQPERRRSAQLVGARPPLDRQHEHPDHAGRHADRRAVPGGSDGAARASEAQAGRGRAGLSAVRVRDASRAGRGAPRGRDSRDSSSHARRRTPRRTGARSSAYPRSRRLAS